MHLLLFKQFTSRKATLWSPRLRRLAAGCAQCAIRDAIHTLANWRTGRSPQVFRLATRSLHVDWLLLVVSSGSAGSILWRKMKVADGNAKGAVYYIQYVAEDNRIFQILAIE